MSAIRLVIVDDEGAPQQAWVLDNGSFEEVFGEAVDIIEFHRASTGIDAMQIKKEEVS